MLYWIGRTLSYIFFKSVFRLKVTGRQNLPPGGFIISTNHNSLLDPPLIGAAISRGVYFMAKKELFEIPLFGRIISMTHAIPVNRRSPGAKSIQAAIDIVKSGKIMMVLPEGTRKSTGRVKAGVGLLAHKTGRPVVPARIINNDRIKSFPRLEFKIKEPIRFPVPSRGPAEAGQYRDFARRVMEEIYR